MSLWCELSFFSYSFYYFFFFWFHSFGILNIMCHGKLSGPVYWGFKCLLFGYPFLSLPFSALIHRIVLCFQFFSPLSLLLYGFLGLFFSYVIEFFKSCGHAHIFFILMSDCISLILSILKPPCLVKSTDDTFDSVFHFNLLSFSFPVLLSPSIFLPPNSVSLPFLVCCVLSYILNCFLQFICLFLSSLNSLTIFTSKFLNSPSGILLISVSLDFVIGEL